MRLGGIVVVLGMVLASCEAVVGVDYGSYSGNCSPLDDKCPASSPCVYNYDKQKFACQAHSGSRGQDETCGSDADCTPGYACEAFQNNTSAHCTRYCSDSSMCPTNRCVKFTIARLLPSGASAGGCGPLEFPCDPISATDPTCAPYRCTLYDTDYTVCDGLEDMRGPNQMCDYLQQCRQGTVCYAGMPSLCRQYCDLASPVCTGGTTCRAFDPPFKLGAKNVGLCR